MGVSDLPEKKKGEIIALPAKKEKGGKRREDASLSFHFSSEGEGGGDDAWASRLRVVKMPGRVERERRRSLYVLLSSSRGGKKKGALPLSIAAGWGGWRRGKGRGREKGEGRGTFRRSSIFLPFFAAKKKKKGRPFSLARNKPSQGEKKVNSSMPPSIRKEGKRGKE